MARVNPTLSAIAKSQSARINYAWPLESRPPISGRVSTNRADGLGLEQLVPPAPARFRRQPVPARMTSRTSDVGRQDERRRGKDSEDNKELIVAGRFKAVFPIDHDKADDRGQLSDHN